MIFKASQRCLREWLAAGAGFCIYLTLSSVSASAETSFPDATRAPAACGVKPFYPVPADPSELHDLQLGLDALVPACLRSASFYAWRGTLLLAQRQTEAAIEALERALLLDPDLPGAQLDYVQALLDIGDTASANGLIQQLAARPDLPANLRPLLERELTKTLADAWRTRWVVSTALGLDSNLNNAPTASQLTLTFPQGAITLPLLESARPQSGATALNRVQWQGLKPKGAQLWLLQAEIQSRHTARAATRYQQADLSGTWLQAPQAPRQWIVRTGASRVDFGGQQLLQSVRVSVLHQWAPIGWAPVPDACRPSAGAELETRRYPASPELNGRYSGLIAAISCSNPQTADPESIFTRQFVNLQMRVGKDQAHGDTRPGGDYRRAEFRASWDGRHGPYKINAEYSLTHQVDSSGYSALLSSNLARRASRQTLHVELSRPLPQAWMNGANWFVSAELNQQGSNLAVFESRQSVIYGGLRWSLD